VVIMTNEQALIQLAREVGDALHRYANAVAAQPSTTYPAAVAPAMAEAADEKPTPAARYYGRQARMLRPVVTAGGTVTVTEGRKIARAAGYGRGWQQLWRGDDGLLKREGDKLSITPKGLKRLEYAEGYVDGPSAA
jgi:hypothetical protein